MLSLLLFKHRRYAMSAAYSMRREVYMLLILRQPNVKFLENIGERLAYQGDDIVRVRAFDFMQNILYSFMTSLFY